MRPKFFIALVALFAALSTANTLAAQQFKPGCQEYLGEASTAFDRDTNSEFGEVRGTINGSMILRYHQELQPIDPAADKPNLLLKTEDGFITAWVTGTSERRGEVEALDLHSVQAEGDGQYAGARIALHLSGERVEGKGGGYLISVIVCPAQ